MGTKARQKSPSRIALMKDKKPSTAAEPSSAQIIKQPRHKKKKRSKKKRSKSQRPHLTVHGRSCSIHSLDSKGLPSESQESATELRCNNEDTGNPSSETDNLGEAHNAKLETEKKKTLRKERTEPSEKPKDVSNSRENKKKIKYPNVVDKKKYQTVSEFQFVYPGKSNFHSPQENTKQNLRSIYQGKVEPKPPRSTQLSVWTPHHQWDIRKSQRGNTSPDANCPVGSDFLRKNPTQALRSLTYKINKLVLVNESDSAPNTPSAPVMNSYFPHLQHHPVSDKTGPLTEAFQRSKRRSPKRDDRVEQHPPAEAWSKLRGFPAPLRNSPRLRPVSAKEHHEKTTDQMLARKRNPNEKLARKERGGPNRPGVDMDGIPQTKSAIIIPTVSHYLSSENLNAKGTPLGWKAPTQFLAEKNTPEGIPVNGSQGELGSSSFSAGPGPKDETSNTPVADETDRAVKDRAVNIGDAGDLKPGSNATE